jgi:predicted nucleic acid-binding Zn ribbon protein
MLFEKRYCRYCSKPIPEERHGNSWHCSDEHSYIGKLKRQKNNRDGYKTFIPTLERNLSILRSLETSGKLIYTDAELQELGLDTSLKRHTYRMGKGVKIFEMSFGAYKLETVDNYQTYKIVKS